MKFIKIPGKDFEMAETPVTQKQWYKVMKTIPFHFKNRPNRPAESISWDDCQEFIKKLNESQKEHIYRLPTEEEWEYCARSCDDQKIEDIAWSWENSKESTQPVKKKKPNKYNLYDMLGNVWEWTDSKWSQDSSFRVLRGGSWGNVAQSLRSANRGYYSPGYRLFNFGFRLVRTPYTLSSKTFTLDDSKSKKALAIARQALKNIEELLK